jgi:UDP-glucose 4-epimerase
MFDITANIAILANIIGPSSRQGVVYDFVSKLISNPQVLDILGNGKQNKSYLHVSDCVSALLHLFDNPEKEIPAIYNVGSDDQISVSEISDIIIQELGLSNVVRKYVDNYNGAGWPGDVREFLLDSSKLKSLGWKPNNNSKHAIVMTVHDLLREQNSN